MPAVPPAEGRRHPTRDTYINPAFCRTEKTGDLPRGNAREKVDYMCDAFVLRRATTGRPYKTEMKSVRKTKMKLVRKTKMKLVRKIEIKSVRKTKMKSVHKVHKIKAKSAHKNRVESVREDDI